MKTVILIDGENFVHKLVKVLVENKLITGRSQLEKYDVMALLELVLQDYDVKNAQVNYYAARVHQVSKPKALLKKTTAMVRWNSYWVPQLANRGIKYIKAGNLQVRDSKVCAHCGRKSLVLQEKGVDVRLAVDMISEASNNTKIVLLSSDSDIAPAIVAARKKGAEITYLGFDFGMNLGLSAEANTTRSIIPKQVVDIFKKSVNSNPKKKRRK
jgi:uncharacterized LabA/DUF88 family protein